MARTESRRHDRSQPLGGGGLSRWAAAVATALSKAPVADFARAGLDPALAAAGDLVGRERGASGRRTDPAAARECGARPWRTGGQWRSQEKSADFPVARGLWVCRRRHGRAAARRRHGFFPVFRPLCAPDFLGRQPDSHSGLAAFLHAALGYRRGAENRAGRQGGLYPCDLGYGGGDRGCAASLSGSGACPSVEPLADFAPRHLASSAAADFHRLPLWPYPCLDGAGHGGTARLL